MPRGVADTNGIMALAAALEDPSKAEEVAFLTPEERYALKNMQAAGSSPLILLGRLGASGRIPPKAVERLYQQTRLMGRAASRQILEMLFEKAQLGDACSYDAQVLMFLAKGLGITSDSKPVTDEERENAAAAAASASTMSDAELSRLVQDLVKHKPPGG